MSIEGTTLVAIPIEEGVVLGLDSMSRSAPGKGVGIVGYEVGSYGEIVSQTYNKAYEFNHNIVCAMAGNLELAEYYLTLARIEFRKDVSINHKTQSTAEIATCLHELITATADYDKAANRVGFLVVGYNSEKVHSVWEVNCDRCTPRGIVSIGSGSSYAKEIVNDETCNYQMKRDEAAKLARKGICWAAINDRSSGGTSIKVFIVKANGLELISEDTFDEIKKEHYPHHMADCL